jgi:hypothetical protein
MAEDNKNEKDTAGSSGVDGGPDNQLVKPGPGKAGADFVHSFGVICALAFQILLAALLAYMLIAFFPTKDDKKEVNYLGVNFWLGRDTLLFVVVITAGALGGITHSLRSLFWYFGNAWLRRRWMLMYLGLPSVGGLFALFFYLLLRGGLLATQASGTDINAYGFAAVGAVVGLFSEQSALKLLDVFSSLFARVQQGSDHSGQATATAKPRNGGNQQGGTQGHQGGGHGGGGRHS